MAASSSSEASKPVVFFDIDIGGKHAGRITMAHGFVLRDAEVKQLEPLVKTIERDGLSAGSLKRKRSTWASGKG